MPHLTIPRTVAVVLAALVTVFVLGGIAEIAAAQHATALAAHAAGATHLAGGPACPTSG